MTDDARDALTAALPDFTDPAEHAAVADLLEPDGPVAAVLSFVDGQIVWLLTGPGGQLAIPIGLLPAMTEGARAGGDLDAFFEAFQAEVAAVLAATRLTLFPPAEDAA